MALDIPLPRSFHPMRLRSRLFPALVLLALASPFAQSADVFVIKPYLQLGDAPTSNSGDLALLWASDDVDANWSVEYRFGVDWKKAEGRVIRKIVSPQVPPHRLYRASLTGLPSGSEFTYQVRKGDDVVFSSTAKARKSAGQAYRFVAVGDIAQGTPAQKAIAERMFLEKPDFVMVPGDIVYGQGRVSEYRDRYWPVYNADETSPSVGGPLLRSTLTLAAPGNHDVANRNLGRYPDGLAYFLYWDQPLNGPKDGPYTIPLAGPDEIQKAFLDSAGPAYPRMANFSLDYGNAHWLVLDADPYVDWRDPGLRSWVERDLQAAKDAPWRFVSFHHPGFNSAKTHFGDQQMRLIADLLEAGKVDVVFSGHVHNYQRSFPTRFVADRGSDGQMVREMNVVPGKWTLDKTFDGKEKTKADGVIYLITGAGGAGLYNPEMQDKPETWQSFTDKFISKVHSITVADVDGKTLTVRQVSASGEVLDRFVVTK
jgi:acid phosphatase type 7